MKLWKRVKTFVTRCWARLTRVFLHPSVEVISGLCAGSSVGRAMTWAWFGLVLGVNGLWVPAAIALVMAVWDLWIHFHVFRFLSEYYVVRTVRRDGVAHVVPLVPQPAF